MGKIPFLPPYTPAQQQEIEKRNKRSAINRAKAKKYEANRAAMSRDQILEDRIAKSPLSRDWYEKVLAFGDGDYGDYGKWDKCLLALAVRGRSLEIMGNLDGEEITGDWVTGDSSYLLTREGKRNGHGEGDSLEFYRIKHRGQEYASTHHYDTTGEVTNREVTNRAEDARCPIEVDIWGTLLGDTDHYGGYSTSVVTPHRGQHLAEYINTATLGAATKEFAYTLVNYGLACGVDELELAPRVLAIAFGWKSKTSVTNKLDELEKAQVFGRDRGRSYGKGGPQTTTIFLDLARFPDTPVASPTVDLNQYSQVASRFAAARRQRADETRAHRRAWRESTNTSGIPDSVDTSTMTHDQLWDYLTRGI